jgi:hypothetical protein
LLDSTTGSFIDKNQSWEKHWFLTKNLMSFFSYTTKNFEMTAVQELLRRHAEARGGATGLGTVLQSGSSRVRVPMVSLECLVDINLPASLWP